MDKELQVYYNRLQKKFGKEPIYSSDPSDECFDLFILRKEQDIDKLDDVWNKLSTNGYIAAKIDSSKIKEGIKVFRKQNKITATIEPVNDFWFFRKEDYSKRVDPKISEENIVPDKSKSMISEDEFQLYFPEKSIFLNISKDHLPTTEMSMSYTLSYGLFSDPNVARNAVANYNSLHFGELTIDNLDKVCQTIGNLLGEFEGSSLVLYFIDPLEISLKTVLEKMNNPGIVVVTNDQTYSDPRGNPIHLKSGLVLWGYENMILDSKLISYVDWPTP